MTTKNTPSQELVPVDPNTPVQITALAQLSEEADPWSEIPDGDMTEDAPRLPYLELNRKLDGGFGDLDHPGDDQAYTGDLEFIWLLRGKSRAQYDTSFSGTSAGAPDCRSADGVVPDPQSPNRKHDTCEGCPFNTFDGPNKDKRCRESVEALVFLADPHGVGRVARLRFGGIAVAPARAYWDSFKSRLPRRPAMAYVTRATLVPTKTDNGTFLKPAFERVAEVPFDTAKPLIALSDQYRKDWQADIARAVQRRTADADEGTNGHTTYEPFPDDESEYRGNVDPSTGEITYAPGDEPF